MAYVQGTDASGTTIKKKTPTYADAVSGAAPTYANSPSAVSGGYSDAMKIINGGGTAGTGSVASGIAGDAAKTPTYGNTPSAVSGKYPDAVSIINGTAQPGYSGLKDADKIAASTPAVNADISGVTTETPKQTTASYIDSNGEKQTGTISYGTATPVADTAALQEAEGASGSTSINYLNQLLDKLNSTYQQQLADADSASAAATQQAINKIQQQIESLNQQYQSTNKQLYADYMLSKKNLPQQLAALGYTGGLTESSLMGLDTSYGASLAENERNRLTDVSNLESGISDAELQAAQDLATQRQSINSDYLSNYATYAQVLQQQKNYENEQAQEEASNEADNELAVAKVKAQYGDFTGMAAIYGADVAAAMKAEYDTSKTYTPTVSVPTYAQIGQMVSNARASGANDSEIVQGLSGYVSDGTLTKDQASQIYGASLTSRSAR